MFNRRMVLSGLAVPALALGLTQVPGLPDQGLPVPGLVTLDAATVDWVLTEATAGSLAEQGLDFSPAPGSVEVPDAAWPSTQLVLSVGSVALDLLSGIVHFDGGFALTRAQEPESEGRIEFTSIASQMVDGVASSWLWVDGEPGERIDAFTYDMTQALIEVDGSTISVGGVDVFLTDQAVDAIQEVFPDAPVSTAEPFLDGGAVATFTPPSLP